uniref:RIIa domain-containing protein n=1 Tax=Ciona savignyi TaxID=51511 RepID=H2YRI7_CIOSA
MDSEYLKTHLGLCLSDALAEVAEKRPLDPIEYIAQFLLKFKENEAFNKKLMQDQRTMSEELQQADDEETVRGQLSTEAKLIKQREEEAIKARRIEDTTPEPTLKDLSNKPGAPSLTAVVEDEETTSPVTRLVMLESQSEPGIDLAVNNIPMVTVTANTPCDEVIPDEALDDKTVADLPKINDDVPNVPKTDDDVPDVPKIDDDVP